MIEGPAAASPLGKQAGDEDAEEREDAQTEDGKRGSAKRKRDAGGGSRRREPQPQLSLRASRGGVVPGWTANPPGGDEPAVYLTLDQLAVDSQVGASEKFRSRTSSHCLSVILMHRAASQQSTLCKARLRKANPAVSVTSSASAWPPCLP